MGELRSNYEKELLEQTDREVRKGRPDVDGPEREEYVWVKGYYKEDGTRVKGHYRSIDGTVEEPIGSPKKTMGLFEKARIRRENMAKRRQEDKVVYAAEFGKHKTKAIKEKARRDAQQHSRSTGEKMNRIFNNISNIGNFLGGDQQPQRTRQSQGARQSKHKKKKVKPKPIGTFSLTEGFDDSLVGF